MRPSEPSGRENGAGEADAVIPTATWDTRAIRIAEAAVLLTTAAAEAGCASIDSYIRIISEVVAEELARRDARTSKTRGTATAA